MKGSKGPGLGLVRVATFLNSVQYNTGSGMSRDDGPVQIHLPDWPALSRTSHGVLIPTQIAGSKGWAFVVWEFPFQAGALGGAACRQEEPEEVVPFVIRQRSPIQCFCWKRAGLSAWPDGAGLLVLWNALRQVARVQSPRLPGLWSLYRRT